MLPTPCFACGKPCYGGRCQNHPRQRPNRRARGYDAEYDRARRLFIQALKRALAAGEPGLGCALCGRAIGSVAELSVEHLRPLRHGGGNGSNLAPAHRTCNYGWRRQRV